MIVSLVGYRGTGKTTVARLLAERLGWEWVDADVEIERRAGQTIAQIFADQGESAFRDLESQVIADLIRRDRCVIAAGGGAVLLRQNRDGLATGPVIWLTAPPAVLAERITGDPSSSHRRPDLTRHGGLEEIVHVLRERQPWYQSVADLTVDTEQRSPSQIAEEIATWLQGGKRTLTTERTEAD